MTATPPRITRRDRIVVGALVLLLGVIAGGIATPSGPATVAAPTVTPPERSPGLGRESPGASPSSPIRIGVLGTATRVNPLTASTRADADLVALVFSGLVALGPGQSLVPDIAASWTTTADGRSWTFTLRDDARWHDGQPVTAADVVFTVGILRNRAYTGPGSASWRDVTATAVDPRTVRFELSAPIGGFLQAATQPIVPAHLFERVPIDRLAESPLNRQPVGAGPYRLLSLDDSRAVLVPAWPAAPPAPPSPAPATSEASAGGGPLPSPVAGPSGQVGPTTSPPVPSADVPGGPTPSPASGTGHRVSSPSASGVAPSPAASAPALPPSRRDVVGAAAPLEVRFYPDAGALTGAYEDGEVEVAGDLPADDALRLAASAHTALVRYPSSTLTAVLFNLRPSRPEFRDPRVRLALLHAIDRNGIVAEAWDGQAVVASAPIPPSSWAFDAAASPLVPHDVERARRGLAAAGWKGTRRGWTPAGASKPLAIDLLSPDVATNQAAFLAASSVAADWQRLGLAVTHVALPPDQLVGQRLRTGNFAAAVVDVNVGLDPDLYPLLASTQTTSRGLNLSGLVDRDLDRLLEAARAPGTTEARRAAYASLQRRLASHQYLLPLAFQTELVVVRDDVIGPAQRQIGTAGDRFWDVLTWRLADDR